MFIHKKELMHPVNVKDPDPVFGQYLLEQFGGATGELTAALQYFTQAQHTDDAALRDMLLDIAVEEFSHLEVVGHLIEAHTKGSQQAKAFESTLFSIRGKGPHLLDSQGSAWSGQYVSEGASSVRDLRADIAAEAGALATYEALLKRASDDGSRDALTFLATREVSHSQMFMDALKAMNKLDDPLFGDLQPDQTVDLYFNLSSSDQPDNDQPAPWIKNSSFKYIADPVQQMPPPNKR
ncbi:manganese catalase family protein [Microvirga sp. TS319]|uniref:manganese catalase family protein n=1 Tax=Microvirga sp. TS319 TaxID=3241165 RepID=UPI00351A8E6D